MLRAALLAFALGALAAGAWLLVDQGERPRNLILVSIDTLRRDRLGAYGYERPTTPFLDSLAARGLVFEDATAPSPWTVPSHVSLLTGLTPQSHGVTGEVQRMDDSFDTLAVWLERHGYDTAGIVNTPLLGGKRGFARGFGSFEVVPPSERDEPAPSIHERALRWLDEPRERPLFLFLHHYDVHSDYAPGEASRRMFVGPYEGVATGTTEQLKAARLGHLVLTAADAKHLSDLYDAEIRQLDDELGRFFEALERRGHLRDTAVVVTADHGEEFIEHGGVLHGRTLHGELVRVPLLLAGPGIPAGRRVAEPASLIDVFPTLTSLLGLEPPPYVEGIDLGRRGWTAAPRERPVFFGTDWWLGRSRGAWKRAVQQGAASSTTPIPRERGSSTTSPPTRASGETSSTTSPSASRSCARCSRRSSAPGRAPRRARRSPRRRGRSSVRSATWSEGSSRTDSSAGKRHPGNGTVARGRLSSCVRRDRVPENALTRTGRMGTTDP